MTPVTFSIIETPSLKRSRSVWDELVTAYEGLPEGRALSVPIPTGQRAYNVASSIRNAVRKAKLPAVSTYVDHKANAIPVFRRAAQAKLVPTPTTAAKVNGEGARPRVANGAVPINPYFAK